MPAEAEDWTFFTFFNKHRLQFREFLNVLIHLIAG